MQVSVFSPCGNFLMIGDDDGNIHLYHINTKSILKSFPVLDVRGDGGAV